MRLKFKNKSKYKRNLINKNKMKLNNKNRFNINNNKF